MLLWVPVALFSAVGAYVLMRYRRVVRESREEVDLSAAVVSNKDSKLLRALEVDCRERSLLYSTKRNS